MTFNMYEVGGCVRDELLHRKSKDIDYSVECESFDAMRAEMVRRGFKIFVENPEFFTIRARFPDSRMTADFVLARREGGYTDGRRPDVVLAGTLLDDLSRRDYTMNAIAKDEAGNLIDPFNGTRDIVNRRIVAVGSAQDRIMEDALRGLRAIRFAMTLGFSIDQDVVDVLRTRQFRDALNTVSIERVREEMVKAFEPDGLNTMALLYQLGLEDTVFSRGLRLMPTLKG